MTPASKRKAEAAAEYGAELIKVLKGLDAVRKRPGMYIGDTDDGSGLHHMVYEVVDNAIDEALAGFSRRDFRHAQRRRLGHGRGQRPRHPDRDPQGRRRLGGRSDHDAAPRRREVRPELLQGVGRPARRRRVRRQRALLQARSHHLARRQGAFHALRRRRAGEAAQGGRRCAAARPARAITFVPSTATFTMVEFDYATLEHRLRELAFLNSGVRIVLSDHRGVEPKIEEMKYEGGLRAFVRFLDRTKHPLINEPIVVEKTQARITIEAALWWNDSYHENVLCFTNNIPQRDGGTHLAGFRAALTRTVNTYAASSGIAKKEKVALTGDDAREGLTCVLSVKVPDPEVLEPDQGQAGLLGGAPGGRERHGRRALRVVRGESRRGAQHRAEDRRGRGGARGGAQGARADAAQGRARHGLAAGQARRLPGARSRQVRAVPGRGRFSRRQRQAGARPRLPGRAPACAARSSMSSGRASTRCCRRRRSAR